MGTTGSHPRVADAADIVAVVETIVRTCFPADVLANEAHHIFTKRQWRKARFLNHPEVTLTMSMNASDYQAFRRSCSILAQTVITTVADTAAKSCLWSITGFLAAGFTPSDLIPVSLRHSGRSKCYPTSNEMRPSGSSKGSPAVSQCLGATAW